MATDPRRVRTTVSLQMTGPLPDVEGEPLIEAFEAAWQAGEPRLEEFLARWTGASPTVRAELALVDLEYRLKRASPATLDDYVTTYPELAADDRFLATATRMLEEARRVTLVTALASDGLANDAMDCRFEDFVLERLVGRGGTAEVHRARRRSTGEVVAVKVLATLDASHPERVVRFLREARIVRRLHHPNIVAMQGVGRTPAGGLFMVMEFVAGGSLDDRLRSGTLQVAEAVQIVASIADALENAHSQGVIHRDLKPANVLLTDHGDVKVTDFGLAKIVSGGELTITTGTVGTAGFMAPEQADRGFGRVGPHTDVYGLGGILYATFTGRPPFVGGSLFEVMDDVCRRDSPHPRSIRRDMPATIEELCLACLRKVPGERPESASLVASRLRAWLRDRI